MRVNIYEKFWMWGAALLIGVFIAAIVYGTLAHALHPPSHVETVDPQLVRFESEFAEPRVQEYEDGSFDVIALAQIYAFLPMRIEVPVGRPITFRITSPDVIHGFQVVGTNANVMVIPGYVTQFTMSFSRPGEYLIVCNEYCGTGHHTMQGWLIVMEEQP